MTETIELPCASCLARNRVPTDKVGSAPTCGRCGAALIVDAPLELDEAKFTPV